MAHAAASAPTAVVNAVQPFLQAAGHEGPAPRVLVRRLEHRDVAPGRLLSPTATCQPHARYEKGTANLFLPSATAPAGSSLQCPRARAHALRERHGHGLCRAVTRHGCLCCRRRWALQPPRRRRWGTASCMWRREVALCWLASSRCGGIGPRTCGRPRTLPSSTSYRCAMPPALHPLPPARRPRPLAAS